MGEKSKIKHKGTIKEITGEGMFVKLEQEQACTVCRAKMFCGADTNEKLVEIKKWDGDYQTGESVIVTMSESLGFRAVFYGYIAPFLVLFLSLIVLISAGIGEGLAGLISISVLFPYYGLLYYFRDSLKKQFTFNITKIY